MPLHFCVPKLPSWVCDIKTKKPGLADQHSALEFFISSPVHSPEPYCLYPEVGLLSSGTEDGPSPEYKDIYTTTRLQASSQVRSLDITSWSNDRRQIKTEVSRLPETDNCT